MKIKGFIDQDFVNYKKPSMTIMFPKCDFKCDRECGSNVCQNSELAKSEDIEVSADSLLKEYYLIDDLTEAIVCQGLEPFDTFDDLMELMNAIIDNNINDDIVIYTGYYSNEIEDKLETLNRLPIHDNIIIKYGRFIPNKRHTFDDILGVELASDNQYASCIEV